MIPEVIKFTLEQDLYRVNLINLASMKPFEIPAFYYQFIYDTDLEYQAIYRSSLIPTLGNFFYFKMKSTGRVYLVPSEVIAKWYKPIGLFGNQFHFRYEKDGCPIDEKYIVESEKPMNINSRIYSSQDVPKLSAPVYISTKNQKLTAGSEQTGSKGNTKSASSVMKKLPDTEELPAHGGSRVQASYHPKVLQNYENHRVQMLELISFNQEKVLLDIDEMELTEENSARLDRLFGRSFPFFWYFFFFAVQFPLDLNPTEIHKLIKLMNKSPAEFSEKAKMILRNLSLKIAFLFQSLPGPKQASFLVCIVYLQVSVLIYLNHDIPDDLLQYNIFGDQPKFGDYMHHALGETRLNRKTYIQNKTLLLCPSYIDEAFPDKWGEDSSSDF
jgi:hypothetical protein